MAKEYYLKILREKDSEDFEFPPDFDYDFEPMKRSVEKIKKDLEQMQLKWELDEDQDASFTFSITIHTFTGEQFFEGVGKREVSPKIVFSNHGNLVVIGGDEFFPEKFKQKICKLINEYNYILIPQEITKLPYDGIIKDDPNIETWYDRYFSWY